MTKRNDAEGSGSSHVEVYHCDMALQGLRTMRTLHRELKIHCKTPELNIRTLHKIMLSNKK
jgi:hypothetical protein